MFQGTVWGPMLWNVFYADAARAIRVAAYTEIVFADDLNAFKAFKNGTPHDDLMNDLLGVQAELHEWGRSNRVTFDAAKKSFHVISKTEGTNTNFTLLGVDFDSRLLMSDAIRCCATSAESDPTYKSP